MEELCLAFKWFKGNSIPPEVLRQCQDLYSSHYGTYSHQSDRPGQRVRMSRHLLKGLLAAEGAHAALAYLDDQLIGYALLVRDNCQSGGIISWVSQLVVHSGYRNRKVATRLLQSAWGFSNHFAWGLATANPYAVRALEAATRRRCQPRVIFPHLAVVQAFVESRISYFQGKSFLVNEEQSVVDTQFFVSHSNVEVMMERSCEDGRLPWTLGRIKEGQEWLAATFQLQPPRSFAADELDRMLADSAGILKEAYARMSLDASHKWAKATEYEIDFAVKTLEVEPGATILDAGCGNGRHSLELAKRGFHVTGVDFVARYIEGAKRKAEEEGLTDLVTFREVDCRDFDLDQKFDGAICLYDVVGSFPTDEDNTAILRNVVKHIRPGGRLLLSVMNRGLVEAAATFFGPVLDNLNTLLRLPPSSLMQTTGEIFNPAYYFFDPNTSLVYRKEQFSLDDQLPCELIVRDRRYSSEELKAICRSVGLEPAWARHVRREHWDTDYPPQDPNAKEVLLCAIKR